MPLAITEVCLSPDRGVWSLASPQPEMLLALAGTVACPTATLKTERFVGAATVPTEKMAFTHPAKRFLS